MPKPTKFRSKSVSDLLKRPTMSPSRLSSMATCPGYISEPRWVDKPAAEEGTMLHECVENDTLAGLSKDHEKLVQYAMDYRDRLLGQYPGAKVEFERAIAIPFCKDEKGNPKKGFIDVLIRTKDQVIIVDWKFGRSMQDEPGKNKQQLAYGAASWLLYQLPVQLHVVYPRLEIDQVHDMSLADMETIMTDLARISVRCEDYLSRLNPGTACDWCGRQPICPAHVEKVNDISKVMGFTAQEDLDIKRLENGDLREIARLRETLTFVAKSLDKVKALTHRIVVKENLPLPGHVLAHRKGTRTITDLSMAFSHMERAIEEATGEDHHLDMIRLEGLATVNVSKLENYIEGVITDKDARKQALENFNDLASDITRQNESSAYIRRNKEKI